MPAQLDLRLADSRALDSSLHVDPGPVVASRGPSLRIVVRGSDLTWTLLSLATDGRRVAPDVPVPVDLPLALVPCGADWLLAASSGETWKLLVIDDDGRVLQTSVTPSWTTPLCIAGQPAAVMWADRGARVAIVRPRGDASESPWVALGSPTEMEGVVALGDGIAIVRAGSVDRPVEVVNIADGTIRTRTRIAGTEGAVAPSIVTAADQVFVLWSRSGRVFLQSFDAALVPNGAPMELATLPASHIVARSFAVARSDGLLLVGYVERERTGVGRGSRGAAETFRTSTWAAVYDPPSRRASAFHVLGERGEAPSSWVGDRLIVFEPAGGTLRVHTWEVVAS